MRKLFATILAAGLLAGPLGSAANAGTFCTLAEKIGVVNIKECEDHMP